MIIQYSIFNKIFQGVYGRKENNSFTDNEKVHEYTVARHMKEFILEAAAGSIHSGYESTYFAKFHKTSYNSCFQYNVGKWIV